MTAGRPAEAREVAGLVAELRALGVCWKRIERLLGWRLSRRTLRKMVAEWERGSLFGTLGAAPPAVRERNGSRISSPREAWGDGPEPVGSAGMVASPVAAASPDVPERTAYRAAATEPEPRR